MFTYAVIVLQMQLIVYIEIITLCSLFYARIDTVVNVYICFILLLYLLFTSSVNLAIVLLHTRVINAKFVVTIVNTVFNYLLC